MLLVKVNLYYYEENGYVRCAPKTADRRGIAQ